ncbi:hypothetical protein H2O73_03905 [Vibrio sp. 404]|uniref:Uncharacterized protein n=1 Tax=Vibrio marinisediminis TaxID=2758441 RepID=A0A7W2FNT2_9VIBR|nr:hypothetical protein [Vibrio marinisediminis]MBA5761480.1 hypothetical protein [Vibrio marinisediminis]
MPAHTYTSIDVPFNNRHTCWFCGEPSSTNLHFPRDVESCVYLEHILLTIPACNECQSFKYPSDLTSIWALRSCIKQALISKYTKHLAIGENWTEQELIDSDFSGAILGGFGKSAWQMYQIAKQRVAFQGWLVSVDDLPLNSIDDTVGFEFNGTHYSSLNSCIDFFVNAIDVDRELLTQLIDIMTPSRFDHALKIAKLNKRISNARRAQIIDEITTQEAEKLEAAFEQHHRKSAHQSIVDVAVSGTIAPAFAIQWALEKDVYTLAELCDLEDDYFDQFQTLGGAAAFASYNGLQLYLKAREESVWIENHDLNKELWR